MLNAAQDARLKELIDLIEKERDSDKLAKLFAELNALLEKKPPSKTPPE